MSEELLQNSEHTETMADYEEHFDDANPWNVVSSYKRHGTPCKNRGNRKWRRHCNGRGTARIYPGFQIISVLY